MNRGIYTGSFDPATIGHIDQIERASRLVDELTVLVIKNYSKQAMFTPEERMEIIRLATTHLDNVIIKSFEGHLATYILDGGFDVHIRGLRSAGDFNYEIQLAQIYTKFYNGKVETVYLMTDPRYSYISSTVVKENFLLGADVSGWVAPSTLEFMKKKFNR